MAASLATFWITKSKGAIGAAGLAQGVNHLQQACEVSFPHTLCQDPKDILGIGETYLSQTSAKQPVRAATLISTSSGVGSLKDGLWFISITYGLQFASRSTSKPASALSGKSMKSLGAPMSTS